MMCATARSDKLFSSTSSNQSSRLVRLGNVELDIPLVKLPDGSGYFCYFKLNDHPDLIEEGARLIAERIRSLGIANPFFVTPEASTLALAHVLRQKYHIDGITLYKTQQINDVDPMAIEYDTVTAKHPKKLFLDKNKIAKLQDKNIFILDSVCTTGGTIAAVFQLLIQANIPVKNIFEATMLFNEGDDKKILNIDNDIQLPIHRFSHLPIIPNINKPASVLFFSPKPKTKFQVVIASESSVKVDAVKAAMAEFYKDKNLNLDFIAVKTASGVCEQPFNVETEVGASNRISDAQKQIPNADCYIAIENGIYEDNNRYFDKAIIKIHIKDQPVKTIESMSVEFPAQHVDQAKVKGFNRTTVGECMFNAGLVKNAKDPHADLGDKTSRKNILLQALQKALVEMEVNKNNQARVHL